MEEVKKEHVAFIVGALKSFFNHIVSTNTFNLQEFFNFMEDKFEQVGYRDPKKNLQTEILIMHDSAVGDFVMQSGAIREIRRVYPKAHITLAVTSTVFSLAEFCPYVDEVIENSRNFREDNFGEVFNWNIAMAEKFLVHRYDVCFAFTRHRDTPILMYMSGAKTRVTHDFSDDKKIIWFGVNDGMMRKLMRFATHHAPLNVYGTQMADACFALVECLLCAPIENRNIEVWFTESELEVAENFLADMPSTVYALSMGGGQMRKHYPPEKYAELLKMIVSEEPDATFVIIGGGEIDLRSAEIISEVIPEIYEDNVIDLTDIVNYRQTAAILSLCDFYIGNDNGAMHIAAALKVPILSVNCFPKDLPMNINDSTIVWRPYNVPNVIVRPNRALPECRNANSYIQQGCRADHPHCISQIEPETLFAALKDLKNIH